MAYLYRMKISKKSLFYIGFFLVLFFTFFFIVRKWLGHKNIISTVQPFSFINQDSLRVTEKDMAGKVYVAEYFFTTCKGICPQMNNNMKLVYEALKNEKDFFILSHTCQPEIDSPEVLKRYADSLGVNAKQWIFLTGPKDSLYMTARLSYTIDDPKNNLKSIDDDFLHTQKWALVDQNGEVKVICDGLKESEVRDLIEEARKLLK